MQWHLIVLASVVVGPAMAGIARCEVVTGPPATDISRLINQLEDERSRDVASKQLGKAGPAAIPALSRVLDGKGSWRGKNPAIRALYDIATPESAAAIKKGLKDADPQVRIGALVDLADLARKKRVIDRMETWESIRPCILDEDSDTRRVAADYLFFLNQTKTVPLVLDALDRELRIPREKRGKDIRMEYLAVEPSDENIYHFQSCLTRVYDKSCLPTIEAYIGKGNKDMDYCLADVLIRQDRTHIHKELLIDGATKCSVPIIRVAIVEMLWQVDDPRVEGILKDALNDSHTHAIKGSQIRYSMHEAAKKSLEKLEMKKQGRDPEAEEAAAFFKGIDAQQKQTTPSLPGDKK